MSSLEVRWIIEKDIFDYTDRLVEYLKKEHTSYKKTNYREVVSYYKTISDFLVDDEAATIFVGSLRTAKEVNRNPVFPGAICNLNRYNCLDYYPSWNDYLLNKDWTITVPPILNRECTYKPKNASKQFFFRPNEGDKSFTGGLFTKSELVKLGLPDNRIIIQANKKEILEEYRFLVVDREIIDSSLYSISTKKEKHYFGCKLLLENALKDTDTYIPDRAFTVDMGYSKHHGIGVIELNSFSCANLYSMNMDKVVPAINDLAKNMYFQEMGD